MRILHAADLHIGRTLHERDLIPDQRAMFDAMLGVLAERDVDVLVLAGDIYDRAIPSPEAISLFDDFLSRAAALPGRPVIVAIPGNHDSAARLSFGAGLFARAGLHLRTRPEDVVSPITVERHGEKALFWALPYLNPGAFSRSPAIAADAPAAPRCAKQAELFETAAPDERCGAGMRSQAELFAEAMDRVAPLLDAEAPNVLVAHCFAAGGEQSGSERSFIGGAEEVPPASFGAFDYVALGHLHRRQAAGPNARYPGTPLAYSFDEALASPMKGFLLVEVAKGSFAEETVALEPLHRLSRMEGSFAELSLPGAFAERREDFVEVRLTDPFPVLDPVDPLRVNFPNLLSVRQAAFELPDAAAGIAAPDGAADPSAASLRGAGPEAVMGDFRSFHAEMHKAAPDAETEALFAELVKEAEHAPA